MCDEGIKIDQNLEVVKAEINCARAFALKHFNYGGGDTILDPPTFDVRFMDVDKMSVAPKIYGRVFDIVFEYRLAWKEERMAWIGKNPLTNEKLLPLWVEETSFDDVDPAFLLK